MGPTGGAIFHEVPSGKPRGRCYCRIMQDLTANLLQQGLIKSLKKTASNRSIPPAWDAVQPRRRTS
eukprot:7354278-Pyramimonas_sp.AAC.1